MPPYVSVYQEAYYKMNTLLVFVSLLSTIVYLLYVIVTKKFNYWKYKNVPFVKPLPLLGNYAKYMLLREYPGRVVQKLCQQFPKSPYFGAFFGTEPVLIVQSPELLKQVLTKDFYYFNGREISKYSTRECVTKNIFFSSDDRWKVVRQNLTPLFSSAKMKNMFYLIEKCSHGFEDALDREISMSNIIEAREMYIRFTMDCICTCAFGVQSNTLVQPENNPFKLMADEIFRNTYGRGLKIIVRSVWPALFYGLGFTLFPPSIDQFFSQMLKDIFASRNYTPSTRNDFVDLVLNLKKEDVIVGDSISNAKTGLDEKAYLKVDDDLMVTQCIMFFAAGFETSATTLGFTLYELAKHPEVQRRAAEEVDEYLRRHDNKLTYDCVTEMPYLHACLYETTRLYPVLGNLTREVMDDVTLPDGLHLDKGVRVHIPVYALHRSPDYFPDPEVYQPERFLPENKNNIVPYSFLAFGEGPRICLGKRFAKMQGISGLISFLKKYRVELAEGMPKTVDFDPRTILIQPRDQGLYLKVSKREGWEQRVFART